MAWRGGTDGSAKYPEFWEEYVSFKKTTLVVCIMNKWSQRHDPSRCLCGTTPPSTRTITAVFCATLLFVISNMGRHYKLRCSALYIWLNFFEQHLYFHNDSFLSYKRFVIVSSLKPPQRPLPFRIVWIITALVLICLCYMSSTQVRKACLSAIGLRGHEFLSCEFPVRH